MRSADLRVNTLSAVASTETTETATSSTTETISGTTLTYTTANIDNRFDTVGSPYAKGDISQFTAESIISGGMWVSVSGEAGGASVKAKAGIVLSCPVGVATETAASGATVNVLTRGLHYFIAEETLKHGETFAMGTGTALNTINVTASGTVGGLDTARGTVLAGAGSEGIALVYLW